MNTSVDLSKEIVVLPPSLFLFIFLFFVASLALSVLSSLGSFVCPLWDLFLTLRATLYFTRPIEDLHTLQEVLNIKKLKTIMMYANVCLCQYSRICNDTSASCRNYNGKAQLACGSSIKQKHV